jgi:tRNA U34 5-methylaminomethyl-2-thiouridine-forming methyltransferase MnmC
MRSFLIAGAGLLTIAGASNTAQAEETVVRSETRPGVAVERREGVVERREMTTGTVDCGSKTIHKEDGAGNSKTVHKEGC